MAKHKITGIKKDAVIKIVVGGGFYFRLAQFITLYTEKNWSAEEMAEVMTRLQDSEPKTDEEYNLITLMSLVHDIEEKAKEQDQLITEEVDLPDSPDPHTKETSPED